MNLCGASPVSILRLLPNPKLKSVMSVSYKRAVSTDANTSCSKRPRVAPVAQAASSPPVQLLRVRGIPAWANQGGLLGLHLSSLIKGDIKWAFITNFMIDFKWLLSACPAISHAQNGLVVVHGEKGAREMGIHNDVAAAGLNGTTTIHAPPLPIAFGTYHSKAFILQYEKGVRVIIHTANLIYPDCNNKTQAVYCQDFPKKEPESPISSPFERDWLNYITSLRLPSVTHSAIKEILTSHDFSAARGHLIVSIPGYHTTRGMHDYGHMKVRAVLNREVFPCSFVNSPVVAQCSSMGSLDEKWLLQEFCKSLSGGRVVDDQGRLLGTGDISIVWPTVEEVRNSLEGWMAGSSIPGPAKNVNKPFLRKHYCSFDGGCVGRQRAMPHIKSYCRYSIDSNSLAWFMIGSHNLSKAAWGASQKGGTQCMIRSYELSILCTPTLEMEYRSSKWYNFNAETGDVMGPMTDDGEITFRAWSKDDAGREGEGTVAFPCPYPLPPVKYAECDVPWSVDTQWEGFDILGRTIANPLGKFYGYLETDHWP